MDLSYVVFGNCKLGLNVVTPIIKEKLKNMMQNQECLSLVYKTCRSKGENQ